MKNLIAKIHLIQKELTPIVKSENNPFYKSKYFDVNMVIEHIMPLLAKHGVVVLQPLSSIAGVPAIKTIISDVDTGELLEDTTPLPHVEDPQKMGSAITYFRRYALTSMFLVQGEEDDDANKTVKAPVSAPKAQPSPVQSVQDVGDWKTYTFQFGKHKGKTMEQVDRESPDYLKWLSEQDNTKYPDLVSALAQWQFALPSGL